MTHTNALDLLTAARSITKSIALSRAERARIVADGQRQPWFAAIFGSAESSVAAIDSEIENLRGRLAAIKDDLIAQGLTQDDCKAIWAQRSGQ